MNTLRTARSFSSQTETRPALTPSSLMSMTNSLLLELLSEISTQLRMVTTSGQTYKIISLHQFRKYFSRSVSALTVSKEYTASPKKFDKKQELRRAKLSKQQSYNNSKKSSRASTTDGHHSDSGVSGRSRSRGRINSNAKKLAGHRMTLLERQNLYAKPRSEGNSPATSRSVSPAKRVPSKRFI